MKAQKITLNYVSEDGSPVAVACQVVLTPLAPVLLLAIDDKGDECPLLIVCDASGEPLHDGVRVEDPNEVTDAVTYLLNTVTARMLSEIDLTDLIDSSSSKGSADNAYLN